MKTISVTINGEKRNIQEFLLSGLVFGSLYFFNHLEIIEETTIYIEGVSCKSIKIFFDFIENQDRFLNYNKFIKSCEKIDYQNLYELLIIFDYFNSSMSNLVYEILDNKPTISKMNLINQIEIYEHVNVLYNKLYNKLFLQRSRYIFTEYNFQQEQIVLTKICETYPDHPSLYKYEGGVELIDDYFIDRTTSVMNFVSANINDTIFRNVDYCGDMWIIDTTKLDFDNEFINQCVELGIFQYLRDF